MSDDSGSFDFGGDAVDVGGDSFTETEERGWLSRLWGALTGVIVGLLLIALCLYGLFWNEGRAVTTARSLAEGESLVVEARAEAIDPANEGALVHVSGDLLTASRVTDAEFGVGEKAIRLQRVVETWQWKETRSSKSVSNFGGSKTTTHTYSYAPAWALGRINSSSFREPKGHVNPEPRFRGSEFDARAPELGAWRPGARTLRLLPLEDFPAPEAALPTLQSRFGAGARLEDGRIFIGADPASPQIGDTRVSYKILWPGPVSFVGRQTGADFTPYMTSAGKSVLLADVGVVPADEMFREAEEKNTLLTWALRALLLAVLWAGFYALLRPFVVLADALPLAGEIVAAGAGLVAAVAALVVGSATIALAWFYYRPVIAALIAVTCVALAMLLRMRSGSGATPAAPPPTAPMRGFGAR